MEESQKDVELKKLRFGKRSAAAATAGQSCEMSNILRRAKSETKFYPHQKCLKNLLYCMDISAARSVTFRNSGGGQAAEAKRQRVTRYLTNS